MKPYGAAKLSADAKPFSPLSPHLHQPPPLHHLPHVPVQASLHHPVFYQPQYYEPSNFSGGGHWSWQSTQYHQLGFNNIPVHHGVGFCYGPPPVPFVFDQGLPQFNMQTLRNKIVQQVEYYFSDENLCKDYFLRSLMDSKGWVPISNVAEFNKLKRMCTNIPFILDVLMQRSTRVEVHGHMIRRRNEWQRWLPVSAGSTTNPQTQVSLEEKEFMESLLVKNVYGHDDAVEFDGGSVVYNASNGGLSGRRAAPAMKTEWKPKAFKCC